jgi:alpha-beta hydrolase superfamily lysophospholipase
MKHSTNTFAFFEKNVFYQTWAPESYSKVALIVHGIAEHSGRHEGLAKKLVNAGYKVYAYDHLGHGKTSGKRGCVRSFIELTALLNSFAGFVHSVENLKLTLIGHSLGTLITLHFLNSTHTYDRFLNNIILSSPAIDSALPTRGIIKYFTKKVAPFLPLLALSDHISAKQLSRDQEEISIRKKDGLILKKSTMAMYYQMFKHMRSIRKVNLQIKVPLLVLLAMKDSVVDAPLACSFFEKMNNEKIDINKYDESFHELFHDLNREEVFKDVINWLEKH